MHSRISPNTRLRRLHRLGKPKRASTDAAEAWEKVCLFSARPNASLCSPARARMQPRSALHAAHLSASCPDLLPALAHTVTRRLPQIAQLHPDSNTPDRQFNIVGWRLTWGVSRGSRLSAFLPTPLCPPPPQKSQHRLCPPTRQLEKCVKLKIRGALQRLSSLRKATKELICTSILCMQKLSKDDIPAPSEGVAAIHHTIRESNTSSRAKIWGYRFWPRCAQFRFNVRSFKTWFEEVRRFLAWTFGHARKNSPYQRLGLGRVHRQAGTIRQPLRHRSLRRGQFSAVLARSYVGLQ